MILKSLKKFTLSVFKA